MNLSKHILLVMFIFAMTLSCGDSKNLEGLPTSPEPDSTQIDEPKDVTEDIDAEEDVYSMWTDPCVECAFYFCPPMNAVWQQQLCFNKCEDPPTLVYEGECIEYLQCDPTQTIIEAEVDCTTEEGLPGVQDKICNKGQIQYTDCVTACIDEICDGIDNDCDGDIDEGFSEIEEVCNNIDDNW